MKVSQESEKVGSQCSPERPDAPSLRAQNSGKKRSWMAERKGTVPGMHPSMVAVVSEKKRELNGNDEQPSPPDTD